MAGIYIHIPFCRKACHYCDFHFSTRLDHQEELLAALKKEILLQRDFLTDRYISTLYFGGGTPSLLSPDALQVLIDTVAGSYTLASDAEITLEANPDDLDIAYIKQLRKSAINRLSIGIQSFVDEDLQWMNRNHTAQQAESSVKRAQDAGISNISIDLIYGLPKMSVQHWQGNLQKAISLETPHLSAYCLTVEPQTALAHFIHSGKSVAPDEQLANAHFQLLMDQSVLAGFLQYEISNFCQPGMESRHNSNYWKGVSYLGIGPSAHSYQENKRRWNIRNNREYIRSLSDGLIPFEEESLTELQQINEYLMVSLRTQGGIEEKRIQAYREVLKPTIQKYLEQGWLLTDGSHIRLSTSGKFYADHIASDLFIV